MAKIVRLKLSKHTHENSSPPIRIPQLSGAIHERRLIVGKISCCYYSLYLALESSTVKRKSVDQPTGDQADCPTPKQQRGRFSCFNPIKPRF